MKEKFVVKVTKYLFLLKYLQIVLLSGSYLSKFANNVINFHASDLQLSDKVENQENNLKFGFMELFNFKMALADEILKESEMNYLKKRKNSLSMYVTKRNCKLFHLSKEATISSEMSDYHINQMRIK